MMMRGWEEEENFACFSSFACFVICVTPFLFATLEFFVFPFLIVCKMSPYLFILYTFCWFFSTIFIRWFFS